MEEKNRYQRHLMIPEIGETGQLRLRESRILIVGLGGLGSAAALYLAAAGVGRIGLVDDDKVDVSNLQRQVIHSSERVGDLKVKSAEDRMRSLNPLIEVETFAVRFFEGNAETLVGLYDVVVDATDNFSTRYLINRVCVAQKKPMIFGAVYQFEGQISVFAPHAGGPCYECLFPAHPEDSSEPIGVFGALPGVIGSLQAVECIKWLTKAGRPMTGRLLVYDALNADFTAMQIPVNGDCPICKGKGEKH